MLDSIPFSSTSCQVFYSSFSALFLFLFSLFPPPRSLRDMDASTSQPERSVCVCVCALAHCLTYTYFYANLCPMGDPACLSYFRVRGWTRQPEESLSASLFSFMPVLLSELWLGWRERGVNQGGFLEAACAAVPQRSFCQLILIMFLTL